MNPTNGDSVDVSDDILGIGYPDVDLEVAEAAEESETNQT